MSARDRYTAIQWKIMGIIYATAWQPPCPHPACVWCVGAEGIAGCTMCPAKWAVP